MVSQNNYVPPPYIPLSQSDAEAEVEAEVETEVVTHVNAAPAQQHIHNVPEVWSSGICACFDDMQSCCVGLFCPCYLFAKNAEFLGSGTLMGSCATHFILWSLVNSFCCVLTDGIIWGLPGCFVACYACGYRRALRSKYNLQEAPCGDFFTHFFCHLCATCQEYREILERSAAPPSLMVEVTAPTLQTMESFPSK
ncbi:protein PLANT CADMIUM RESISTANCE 10 [Henckelia pumila]|uniref:protein PLANT CADMIUM RESISTANCE 10 n=1 Tax=Henckelia pumila TaxID=405737 RepID=UPI003C6E1334